MNEKVEPLDTIRKKRNVHDIFKTQLCGKSLIYIQQSGSLYNDISSDISNYHLKFTLLLDHKYVYIIFNYKQR